MGEVFGGMATTPAAAAALRLEAESLVNKKLLVELKDGRSMTGYLTCFDDQGNLILSQAEELGLKITRLIGSVIIPKHFRTSIYAEVEVEEKEEEEGGGVNY